MRYRLIAALQRVLITSDYKTVEKKFKEQKVDTLSLKLYMEEFKKLKNRIKDVEKKNIDYWGSKDFNEFKTFVDHLKEIKSKRQIKKAPWKMETPEGAEKVAENDEWVVYRVDTFEASQKLGTRNWCISRNDEHWASQTKGMQFYYLLSKTKSYKELNKRDDGHIDYEDVWHRIALQVSKKGEKIWWDANDKAHNKPNIAIDTIPKFDIVFPEHPLNQVLEKIKEGTANAEEFKYFKDEIYEDSNGEFDIKRYDSQFDFFVMDEYDEFNEFAKHHKGLKWIAKQLEDGYWDVNVEVSDLDFESILGEVEKLDPEMYTKFIEKVIKDTDFVNWVNQQNEDTDDKITPEMMANLLQGVRSRKLSILADYIKDDTDDTNGIKGIFERAFFDGVRSATENMVLKELKNLLKNNAFIMLTTDSIFDKILEGLPSSQILDISDYEEGTDLKYEEYDYEYPDDKEIATHLIEYSMSEWLA